MDRSARHGPNRLLDYLTTHETVVRRFEDDGLVEEDGLEFVPAAEGRYLFQGYILLRDRRLKVTVTKLLETVGSGNPDDPMVQTVAYSYNVSIIGHGNVFRYCSPHDENDDPIDHHRQHHRHQYDPLGSDRLRSTVSLITDGDWPTLGQVVQEADAWYLENIQRLDQIVPAAGQISPRSPR